jgi:hypothetical protein
MTREEFLALPVTVQVRLLVEVLGVGKQLAGIDAPKPPRSPKYDMRISRKGGYQWASETDLEGLRFWLHRFESNAKEGGQYAEKDGKRAEKLTYWVSWREAYPDAVWTGQRNDDVCTASRPTSKPTVHEWEERRDKPLRDDRHDADDTGGGDDSFPAGW